MQRAIVGCIGSIYGIGEMAKTRPGGFSLAVYSLLGTDTSFFGCGLLYAPYVPHGVCISGKIKSREADFFLAAGK